MTPNQALFILDNEHMYAEEAVEHARLVYQDALDRGIPTHDGEETVDGHHHSTHPAEPEKTGGAP